MEILALLVVFAAVSGVMVLLLGGLRPSTATPRIGTAADGPPIGWISPFVAMLAVSSIVELAGSTELDAARLGAGFGVLAFLCTLGGRGVQWLVDGLGSVAGAVATGLVVVGYLEGTTCGPAALTTRIVSVVLMATLFCFSLLHTALLRPGQLRKVGLAAFGAVEAMVFLASPLGVELAGWGAVVSTLVALVLGAVAGAMPDLVVYVVAPGLGLVLLGTTVAVGDACTVPGTSPGVVLAVAFAAVLFVLSLLALPLRRRTRS